MEDEECRKKVMRIDGEAIENVDHFRYLGRSMVEDNEDWGAAIYNVQRSRKRWGRVHRVLIRDGAEIITTRNFYIAVVQ